MASPPSYFSHSPTATSPPYQQQPPPQTTTSKKRTAGDIPLPQQPHSLKRRKASNMSVSSLPTPSHHPLRQTSFPPESLDDRGPFAAPSPSVADDNMSVVSASAASAAAGPAKKKRGRKPKNAKADADAVSNAPSKEATPSLVGGRAPTGAASTTGDANGAAADDDDDEANAMNLQDSGTTEEQRREENRLRGLLAQALDTEQYSRYEIWRATRIPDAAVRRIINTTVSQSVPVNAVLTTKLIAKIFVGDIIESARRIQGEWMRAEELGKARDQPIPPPASDETPAPGDPAAPGDPVDSAAPPPTAISTGTAATAAADTAGAAPAADGAADSAESSVESMAKAGDWRGPLLPAHLHEAVRRYRAGGEGGVIGGLNLWHHQQSSGAERFSARNSKRIFR